MAFTINKRLPPEILSEIFVNLCTIAEIPWTMRKLEELPCLQDVQIPPQWSLTSVCRSWRSIAHSTPALWTSLAIYIPYRNMPQRIQDIKQWISRSGQLPLSIQVHHHPSVRFAAFDPLADDLINLIKSYLHRCETLEINLVTELLLRFSHSNNVDAPPILKTLILAPWRVTSIPRPLNLGVPLPRPTHVSLFSRDFWPVGICWDDVTHFTGRYMGLGQATEFLRLASSQLQEVILFQIFNFTVIDIPPSPVLHAHLEILHLYCSSEGSADEFMHNITLPSLKNLNFNGHRCPLPIFSMRNFLTRSGCPLETFSLQDAELDEEDDVFYLLCAMPHLESLTLASRYITDRFLGALAETAVSDQAHTPFLPKLRALTCIGRPKFSWPLLSTVFRMMGESSDSASESGASDSGTSESGASGSGTSNSDAADSGISESFPSPRRPLRSFTVEQEVDDPDYPDANVKVELDRLRAEGYTVDIVLGPGRPVMI